MELSGQKMSLPEDWIFVATQVFILFTDNWQMTAI